MVLQRKFVLLTGASMGIGEAIANSLAEAGANLALFSRTEERLASLAKTLTEAYKIKVIYRAVDVGDDMAVDKAVSSVVSEGGNIDILINNAGLALGAPAKFPELDIAQIKTMNATNVNGLMFTTYSVLNKCMMERKEGTILNITSVTGLEVPPFPGEAVYHANKACQEAFTNALRNELTETNIRVLALRPGCVATNFHSQRVGHDKVKYNEFFEGFQPLIPRDIAEVAVYMLNQDLNVSIKAMDVVPSAQRSLPMLDRTWNERNGL